MGRSNPRERAPTSSAQLWALAEQELSPVTPATGTARPRPLSLPLSVLTLPKQNGKLSSKESGSIYDYFLIVWSLVDDEASSEKDSESQLSASVTPLGRQTRGSERDFSR